MSNLHLNPSLIARKQITHIDSWMEAIRFYGAGRMVFQLNKNFWYQK